MALHGAGGVTPFETGNPHVFGYRREHHGCTLLALASFSEHEQAVADEQAGLRLDRGRLISPGRPPRKAGDRAILEPYGFAWLEY